MLIVAMIHFFIYDTLVKDYVDKSRSVNDFIGCSTGKQEIPIIKKTVML